MPCGAVEPVGRSSHLSGVKWRAAGQAGGLGDSGGDATCALRAGRGPSKILALSVAVVVMRKGPGPPGAARALYV